MKCDNCGRAVLPGNATAFPKADIVLCERAKCDSVANEAKLLYYEQGVNSLRGELGL